MLKLVTYPLSVQRTAVEEREILHRDGSLNNTMIGDDGNGSHGMLIDWEFAVDINGDDKYTIGGTVSNLFVFDDSVLTGNLN